MPAWLFFSLLAASLWAIVNVLDKKLLSDFSLPLNARLFLDMIVSSIVALVCLPFIELDLDLVDLAFGLIAGIFLFLFNINYYKSLQQSSVMVIAIYLQLIPIFSFILGWFFFGERFSSLVYLGIALIILGAVLVTIDTGFNIKKEIHKNVTILFRYVIPGAIFISINYGLIEYLLNNHQILAIYFFGRLGVIIASMYYFIRNKEVFLDLDKHIFKGRKKIFKWVTLIEVLNISAIYFIFISYASGSITLVATAASTQPLFVIIITAGLFFFSSVNISKLNQSTIIVFLSRLLAAVIQIIGIYFLLLA